MKQKDRFLVVLATFFWAMLGLFFLGTLWGYGLPILALIYWIWGGEKHGA